MVVPTTSSGIIAAELQRYGLSYSQAQMRQWSEMVADDPQNISIVRSQIEQSTEYQQRFPGLQQRLDNGYNAISAGEYLELEDAYRSVFRTLGMPTTFYDDPSELADLIANDQSPSEVEERAAEGFLAAKNAPPEVKQALQEFYGVQDTDGALAAYYLDPDKGLPAIQREFVSSQIAGSAQQTGFGAILRDEAEGLQAIGVTGEQARSGFSELAQSAELFTSMPGSAGGVDFSRQELLDATFEKDADVLSRIRRQREGRTAAFQGPQSGQGIDQRGVTAARTGTGAT